MEVRCIQKVDLVAYQVSNSVKRPRKSENQARSPNAVCRSFLTLIVDTAFENLIKGYPTADKAYLPIWLVELYDKIERVNKSEEMGINEKMKAYHNISLELYARIEVVMGSCYAKAIYWDAMKHYLKLLRKYRLPNMLSPIRFWKL
ncbi:MAG: hypothetical protein SFW35_13780 [Chitinophagales bacterium]|nr:hypothetical protein [Chitinophagales bacterium]